ncbi:MAG TPA: hypothetical protein VG604_01230 [Candidatus Saccharimonadales bacterium]|nr:hypothetical protein [Candidatus Saccharimonadales bacterium]
MLLGDDWGIVLPELVAWLAVVSFVITGSLEGLLNLRPEIVACDVDRMLWDDDALAAVDLGWYMAKP